MNVMNEGYRHDIKGKVGSVPLVSHVLNSYFLVRPFIFLLNSNHKH